MVEQQIRFCTSDDGVRIAYAVSGSGPPLLKVANWLSHLEFDWDSPVWRHWLTALSSRHTLIRYDKRGCGLSDWDVRDLSFGADVQDLKAVAKAAGLHRCALLGISAGGSVAISYAHQFPERVARLVLYGAYSRGRMRRAHTPQQVEEAQLLLKAMEYGWGQDNAAFRQIYTSLFLPEGTPEQMGWFNELQRISTSPHIATRIFQSTFQLDVSSLVARLRVPTLVMHVRGDAVIPFEEGRQLAALIPGARFVLLEGRNHVLLEHEPAWPRFVSEIEGFLAAPEPEPAPVQLESLTPREAEILELLAQGESNEAIAARLVLSAKTVRNHVTHLYDKLGVENRAQAIVLAHKAGIGSSPS